MVKNGFGAFRARKNTSDKNKFGTSIMSRDDGRYIHYNQSGTKQGQGLEFMTIQIQHHRRPLNFPGTGCLALAIILAKLEHIVTLTVQQLIL